MNKFPNAKTPMFYPQNCDHMTFQKFKKCFFSTAIITQLEGQTQTSSSHDICMITECQKFFVYLTDLFPQSKAL